ncbi:MAG: hypothetical protein H7335_13910 [Massilia sp.]|nr:hypothetical protein [Massilia sp.]
MIRSNLIIACSDDGIYLNSAARSKIVHNSLVDTDGRAIRGRNGAIVRGVDNLDSSITALFLGLPAPSGDARLLATPARRRNASAMPLDLCGQLRPVTPVYGAFEDLSSCR